MSEANTPGQCSYTVIEIADTKLIQYLITLFNRCGPGIANGVDPEQHRKMWEARAAHCTAWAVLDETGPVSLSMVHSVLEPDPHFPFQRIAQVEFTATLPGHSKATCLLYRHMKRDLRERRADALLISRMISPTEIRVKIHPL